MSTFARSCCLLLVCLLVAGCFVAGDARRVHKGVHPSAAKALRHFRHQPHAATVPSMSVYAPTDVSCNTTTPTVYPMPAGQCVSVPKSYASGQYAMLAVTNTTDDAWVLTWYTDAACTTQSVGSMASTGADACQYESPQSEWAPLMVTMSMASPYIVTFYGSMYSPPNPLGCAVLPVWLVRPVWPDLCMPNANTSTQWTIANNQATLTMFGNYNDCTGPSYPEYQVPIGQCQDQLIVSTNPNAPTTSTRGAQTITLV